MPILITGGTGTLGRRVVTRLSAAQAQVRVLSRSVEPKGVATGTQWCTGDLRTGEGLEAALADVDTIVHCATNAGTRRDVDTTRNLIAAAEQARRPHLVYISIVGVDRFELGYYRAKLEVERMLETSGLPYTILRATQFHDLIQTACAMLAKSPIMLTPSGTSFQPIDPDEVAFRLVELATAKPAGRVPDIGGPEVVSMQTLARSFLDAGHLRRGILPVRFPGSVAAGYRRGDHLAPDRPVGRITFDDFLRRTRATR